MSVFASKLRKAPHSLRPKVSVSRPAVPTSDKISKGNQHSDVQQVHSQATTDKVNPKKLSAVGRPCHSRVGRLIDEAELLQEETLHKLLGSRIYSSALNIAASGPCKKGGKAEVAQATFRRNFWNHGKRVAVKKLRYYRSMDKHKFSNVRGISWNTYPETLTYTLQGIYS